MVWHEHCTKVSHPVIRSVFILALCGLSVAAKESPRFYYSFATPKAESRIVKQGSSPAMDANTMGDVPDSNWYTRRHYYKRMSLEELKRGPGNSTPPSSKGSRRVVAAKSDGVTPGFVIEDQSSNRYVLKLDPLGWPELASAADMIGSKLFYALGYSTPENYIVHFRRENLTIAEGVMWHDPNGRAHPMTARALNIMLRDQPLGEDGTYRALASRIIEGKLIGPFSYDRIRTDDPNDIIPHRDRRVLRGMAVFAAWVNNHDTRSINTMDTLTVENGVQFVKHYLIDFGSALGSAGYREKFAWMGNQYVIDPKDTALQMVTFGFDLPKWARTDYPRLTGTGRFDSWSFDPAEWKPEYPNPAFLLMNRDDAFWAAKQVAAFTDEEIRAIVSTGEYSDPRAADWIASCLMERRDKIAETWLSVKLPLDKFTVEAETLNFEDLGNRMGTRTSDYAVQWSYVNYAGDVTAIEGATGTRIPAVESNFRYLVATIRLAAVGKSPVVPPVSVYLRPGMTGMKVVGIDR